MKIRIPVHIEWNPWKHGGEKRIGEGKDVRDGREGVRGIFPQPIREGDHRRLGWGGGRHTRNGNYQFPITSFSSIAVVKRNDVGSHCYPSAQYRPKKRRPCCSKYAYVQPDRIILPSDHFAQALVQPPKSKTTTRWPRRRGVCVCVCVSGLRFRSGVLESMRYQSLVPHSMTSLPYPRTQ